jgi:tetratricopeptide (TPR) repeat protein
LFVERVRAVQPGFQVTQTNAKTVADICQRLDGIPLALELAAARVRALSVDEIAARLKNRFHLLTGGDRTALPRQRTLHASIDWSYDLLTDHERALLRRLAVFAGGWKLEAAEAVCIGGEPDLADVVDLLSQLIEKSLVALEPGGERYRMLDTVRAYAQERLRESGEGPDIRSRHLNCYLLLAEKARPELVGPIQGKWLKRLDLERENFLTADAWCDVAEDGAEQGLKLAHALKRYWLNRGLLALGHRLSVEALARAGAQARDFGRCQTLFDAGQLGSAMGRYREAFAHLDECLSIARELGNKVMVAAALQPLGLVSLGLGDAVSARGHFEEAYALAQDLGDKRQVAAALNALAQLDRLQGKLDTAKPLYEKVLELAREVGDRESIAVALLNLAMVSIGRGSVNSARKMLLEVLAIADESGFKPAGQSVLEVCAGLGAVTGEWELAARFFGAAEAQISETGLRRDPADEAFLAPLVVKARDALGPEPFSRAEVAGRSLSYEAALLGAHEWLESRH